VPVDGTWSVDLVSLIRKASFARVYVSHDAMNFDRQMPF
jgi:hypothetical protein